MVEVIGYVLSLFIGISLGLIGGGGSILTVPLLVYLFGIPPVTATAYSLFVVGSTSLIGAYPKYKQGRVDLKTALIFGLPAMVAVFFSRSIIVPNIPEEVFTIASFVVTKSIFMMLLFSALMLLASISMIQGKNNEIDAEFAVKDINYPIIIVQGLAVGLITGLVGAGGGFLIIPALVLLCQVPIKQAIGTSLLIIGVNSLIGFTGDLGHTSMDWQLLLPITGLAIVGIFIGNYFSNMVSAKALKRGFGWFVLSMGIYIIIKELFL